MAFSSDELLDFLKANGIEALTTEHEPVFTVAQSRLLRGDIAGMHTKNLFLRDAKRNYFLVVLNEDTDVDLKQLRGLIAARGNLSRKVKVVLEESLLGSSLINGHPLVNHRTTSLTPEQLLKFLDTIDHEPMRVTL